jgi:hypothetical protein
MAQQVQDTLESTLSALSLPIRTQEGNPPLVEGIQDEGIQDTQDTDGSDEASQEDLLDTPDYEADDPADNQSEQEKPDSLDKANKLIRKQDGELNKLQNTVHELQNTMLEMAERQDQLLENLENQSMRPQEPDDPLSDVDNLDYITKEQLVKMIQQGPTQKKEEKPKETENRNLQAKQLAFIRRMPQINKVQNFMNDPRNEVALKADPLISAPTDTVGQALAVYAHMLQSENKRLKEQMNKRKSKIPPTGGEHKANSQPAGMGGRFSDKLGNTLRDLGVKS